MLANERLNPMDKTSIDGSGKRMSTLRVNLDYYCSVILLYHAEVHIRNWGTLCTLNVVQRDFHPGRTKGDWWKQHTGEVWAQGNNEVSAC